MFGGCFFEFLNPFILGGHNFLISNLFLMIVDMSDVPRGGNFLISDPFSRIVNMSDAQRERFKVLFGHPKQQSVPLGSGRP